MTWPGTTRTKAAQTRRRNSPSPSSCKTPKMSSRNLSRPPFPARLPMPSSFMASYRHQKSAFLKRLKARLEVHKGRELGKQISSSHKTMLRGLKCRTFPSSGTPSATQGCRNSPPSTTRNYLTQRSRATRKAKTIGSRAHL